VHSFAAQAIADQRLGTVAYGGVLLSAAVHKDAITGVQFHPEKSGPSGLRLLENFTKKT
jgi:glutamine amidotransferase